MLPTDDDGIVEIFLDRTPFAESGGQIGDTGTIRTDTGLAEGPTPPTLPGLRRRIARRQGEIEPGQGAVATIDVERRRDPSEPHRHALAALGAAQVLGPHVKQAGSLIAPDRCASTSSHYSPVTPEEIADRGPANHEVLANPRVSVRDDEVQAEALSAIAFFGDKYGDVVRVLERPALARAVRWHAREASATSARSRSCPRAHRFEPRRIRGDHGHCDDRSTPPRQDVLAEAAGLESA